MVIHLIYATVACICLLVAIADVKEIIKIARNKKMKEI